jgi:hypothetical protein
VAQAEAASGEWEYIRRRAKQFAVHEYGEAVAFDHEANHALSPPRPVDVRAPERRKRAGVPPVDLEVFLASWREAGVIADREQVIVVVVLKAQDESAVVDRIRFDFDPAVVKRSLMRYLCYRLTS